MNDPVQACLQAGFEALMRGDLAERDRQVERARRIMQAEKAKPSSDASRDQIVAKLIDRVEREFRRPATAEERAAIAANPGDLMRRMLAAGVTL